MSSEAFFMNANEDHMIHDRKMTACQTGMKDKTARLAMLDAHISDVMSARAELDLLLIALLYERNDVIVLDKNIILE